MRWRLAGLGAVLLVVAISCPPVLPPADPAGPAGSGVRIETVIPEARFPVALTFVPDGRAFFTEKETGQVRILTAEGQLLADPLVDVPVAANSERGLLGIVLHPDFGENGLVYVYYTRSSTGEDTRTSTAAQDNRVVRFTVEGNVGRDETLILSLPVTPGPIHNGGNLRFGPDGKLYVTIGEVNQRDRAQTLDTLAGKILRIDVDRDDFPTDPGKNYATPADSSSYRSAW